MSELFIIQNQHQQYLDKHGNWLDGGDSHLLYRTTHRDEAVNVKVEHAVRSPDMRLKIITATCNERGQLLLDATAQSGPSIDSSAARLFTKDAEISSASEHPPASPAQQGTETAPDAPPLSAAETTIS